MMDVVAIVLGSILLLTGFVSCFLPLLPGPVVSYAALRWNLLNTVLFPKSRVSRIGTSDSAHPRVVRPNSSSLMAPNVILESEYPDRLSSIFMFMSSRGNSAE